MVRLAYGVVAGRDLRVWAPGPDGVVVDAARAGLRPGTAVVVGPRGLDRDLVAYAVDGLSALVAAGGAMAAGAGVEVGAGFRTARLAGAGGDRRDAVLAALRALSVGGFREREERAPAIPAVASERGLARLGDRAGLLVALFGTSATKPVGAAATAALHDGRWAALHLASAASDLLDPEQLERLLRLAGPAGLDREVDGLASVLAGQLARVLGPLSKPRRMTMLLDLWNVVGARWEAAARRRRLLDVQGDEDRLHEVRERYQRLVDDQVLADVGEARPVHLARWTPSPWHWQRWLNRTMHDALAATVLLRAAVAVAENGLEAGIALVRPQLATAPILLTRKGKAEASRRVAGPSGVPARPGAYVLELDTRLRPGTPIDARTAAFVEQRLARARDYGIVTLQAVRELVDALGTSRLDDLTDHWTCEHLRRWREVVGYSAVRPPEDWDQPVLARALAPLAQRLRDRPDAAPIDVEHTSDLLWYAELADAMAQLNGHDAAAVVYDEGAPIVDPDPPAPAVEPLRPSDDSVALALAGAAQLIDLGAEVPSRPRTWAEFIDGLLASTVVAEALTGSFQVATPLLARDGGTLPGTEVRLEIARDPHQLAEWARFMGNCIAGPYYLGAASRGRSVLAALRDPNGRMLANLELRPHRTGWRIGEFRARFNGDPESELTDHVLAWVAALPPNPTTRPAVAPRPHGHGSVHRQQRRTRLLGDVRESLVPLAADAMQATGVAPALDVLSEAGTGAPAGLAGVTALRRARRRDIDEALRNGLANGTPDLMSLWRATAVRPLAAAVAGLDPALRERYGFLDLLLSDGPLPAVPRRLARVPGIAEARSVELVARRLRRAIGRLARAADPVLAQPVPRYADTGLLCALVLAVSTDATAPASALTRFTRRGDITVPGYPVSTLDDEEGPWRQAAADAEELGAELSWRRPTPALAVPSAWLGRGGWPALWARANRAAARR